MNTVFKVGDKVRVLRSVTQDNNELLPAYIAEIYPNEHTVYLIWKNDQGYVDCDGYYDFDEIEKVC